MELENLFTDSEKEQLHRFATNDMLKDLVKKVVLSAAYGYEGTFSSDKPLENFCLAFAANDNLTQKQKGEKLDAALLAVQLLNDGFARLQKFNIKKSEQGKDGTNQAR